MKIFIVTLLFILLSPFFLNAQITIEECVGKAENNYPLIKKYGLLEATLDIDLSEINTSWLPRIGVYGQVTAQNLVPAFPKALTGVLDQMGQSVKGLGKIQYKIGGDVSQQLWDGGTSLARKEVAHAQEEVRRSSLNVEMYAIRQRVESIYFAILLTEEQIAQSEVAYNLLLNNLEKLRAMLRNGVAMQSDIDMVEAQSLMMSQNISKARSAVKGYRVLLELFVGESLEGKNLCLPSADMPMTNEPDRPELRLFDCRCVANIAANRLYDSSLMPKIGAFAQAYYGYPGLDYFRSMMSRDLSFNIFVGIKVSWNIDSFYSKRNNAMRKSLTDRDIAADRDLFLFNIELQSASQTEAIKGLRDVMKDDARIIALCENVREAAESQLENGIIDTTALLTKISDENVARLNARLHEIQLLQEIYNLKYTLNR